MLEQLRLGREQQQQQQQHFGFNDRMRETNFFFFTLCSAVVLVSSVVGLVVGSSTELKFSMVVLASTGFLVASQADQTVLLLQHKFS